jgi:large subunit ribosomal protein L5
MAARLKETYLKEVVPTLMKQFSFKNRMQVPRLQKIVLNVGLGKQAIAEAKVIDMAVTELGRITGQKPVVTKAKKAISNFKLRKGLSIGCMVTLRQERMFEFMDRLCNVALPRVRDFKGVSPKGFDGRGSYTLGLKEHVIFPEIDFDKVEKSFGMNVTFVTTAKNKEETRGLLTHLGMMFREN